MAGKIVLYGGLASHGTSSPTARGRLPQEARALLTGWPASGPFALVEPMVPAAGLFPSGANPPSIGMSSSAGIAVAPSVQQLPRLAAGPGRAIGAAAEAQRRFALLRRKFNAALTQFDSSPTSSRSGARTRSACGCPDWMWSRRTRWPCQAYYEPPPVICYLDRGLGAAIRRARTRMPGGGKTRSRHPRAARTHDRQRHRLLAGARGRAPGSGTARSRRSLRPVLRDCSAAPASSGSWQLWERWISEIVADFWSSPASASPRRWA